MSAADLAAELKRLEEELERKKMEEKIQSLKAQLVDDDEYVEESEYYEEEVEEEYEEEVYYEEEEEYYEGDEYEEEDEYAQEEYYEEEESEPVVPAPRPAAPLTYVAPPPPAQKPYSATSAAPVRQPTPVTRAVASPSVRASSSVTPATSPPRQMKKIVKRKVNLTGKPKYITGTVTATETSAQASKAPITVPAPASAPSPAAPAAQPKAGVRRIFGFGKKESATDNREVAPATVPVTSTSKVAVASTRGAASGPQSFKARTYAKEPASPAGQETPMEQILGPDLFAESKLIRRSVLTCTKDRDLTLLYFASKWNRECKEFYPALKDFYCTIALPQNLEIVYVSHDRSLGDFKEIFATMPWPAMPTGTSSLKNELAKNLKIIETPALAVLDTNSGRCITTHAMSDVAALERKNYEQANALVNTWRSIKPIPFDEVMMDVRLKHGKLERKPLYWQE